MSELYKIIDSIQLNPNLRIYDEAATKQSVILPILHKLGWDIFNRDEVFPEYTSDKLRVDYALRILDTTKALVEVKKVSEKLENHSKQLLTYAFQEGAPLAILTNGITWWFYLPLKDRHWEERKFLTLDLIQQDSDEISERFMKFLSRSNVNNGSAIENAQFISNGRIKYITIKKALPSVWHNIMNEPDDLFIELLTDKTEKVCGYKPSVEIIEKFIKDDILIPHLKGIHKIDDPGYKIKKTIRPQVETPIDLKDKKSISLGKKDQSKFTKLKSCHPQGTKLILNYKELTAIGIQTGDGIKVLKGSQATTHLYESLKNHYLRIRNKLIDDGILKKEYGYYLFMSDYRFESLSAAASVICGSSRNGKKEFLVMN